MSANDDLKIFLNIMAQSDSGLGDPQLIGKFAKSKAMLHRFDSMNQIQAQLPPPAAPLPTPGAQVPMGGQEVPPAPNQVPLQGQPQIGKYDNL
jgi:hypothetical protein